jgi:hypothetical protein
VRREALTEGVGPYIFVNPCFDSCLAKGFLQNTPVSVMMFHVSIILRQGIGMGHFSVSGRKVARVKAFHHLELGL